MEITYMTKADQFKDIYRTKITREGATDLLKWLESTDFFTAPASSKFHGSYPGGLVDHSLNVYFTLIDSPVACRFSAETCAICALLHDVCKAEFYKESTRRQKNAAGVWETVPYYTVKDGFPFGHGEKSALLISRFMQLTDEEALAIRWHMGAYDDAVRGGSWTLSAAMARTPLVLALHTADMMATELEKGEEQA